MSEEPIAYMRRWAYDGEKPYKERSSTTGRMRIAPKFIFHEVSVLKIMPDDIPLYVSKAKLSQGDEK